MNYKIFLLIILINLNSCVENPLNSSNTNDLTKKYFVNKGFTLIYSPSLKSNKLVSKKIDDRELLIFQKNLKKNTSVKITNLLNDRSILVKVGVKADYPDFFNSVISQRIAEELKLSIDEPYIQITELAKNSHFIAKESKMFEEEKNVATKVPVDKIKVSNLSEIVKPKTKKNIRKFNYTIKIADLYFKDSANMLVERIKNETPLEEVLINKLSKSKYRVFLGPFDNIKLLQNAFNDIRILQFENIEIIYND